MIYVYIIVLKCEKLACMWDSSNFKHTNSDIVASLV